jgi:hypothetical protein
MVSLVSGLVEPRGGLATRREVQEALRALVRPLAGLSSPGGARVRAGPVRAHYPAVVAELEGFARPLWGLAPLAAGGGEFDGWERLRAGLSHGTDPAHPEFWGVPGDRDQRLVEMAAIAAALLLAPSALWDPLRAEARQNVVSYMRRINGCEVFDSNWLFFRVIVNLALSRLSAGPDLRIMTRDLDRLDSFARGRGWYSDGPDEPCDYYAAFGMHFYGLLYAALSEGLDPERSRRLRERAAVFARQFIHWFAADGSALPYGRSLTYRFAQGAFWGALAFAGVEALPWGVVKGLLLRHLRWWLSRPILEETGVLSLGYAYSNLNVAEAYNASGSPYWAFKAFLPLALPESHPFWAAEEEPLPDLPAVVAQPEPRLLVCRDRETGHVMALAGGQWVSWHPRHAAEKYSKFCYSTRFGFSVPRASAGLAEGAFDSTLALSEDAERFRVRGRVSSVSVDEAAVVSRWRPWPDVSVCTWLVPAGPWHVRVHRIRSGRRLFSAEGGFALGATDPGEAPDAPGDGRDGAAAAELGAGVSLIRDLAGGRVGRIVRAADGTNLLEPRTVIPTLVGEHPKGEFWLACAVLGHPPAARSGPSPNEAPAFAFEGGGFVLKDGLGRLLYRQS